MTFQTEIEAALAKPVDKEIMAVAKSQVKIKSGHECRLIYTLLLQIRDLQAQVEQERWRDAENEKPKHFDTIMLLVDGIIETGKYSEISERYLKFSLEINNCQSCNPTHWKPINLPSVLTK